MPSSSNRHEEKHSLLKDETEGDSCLEGSSRAPSVDQKSGAVNVKETLLWRSIDPAWKSWFLVVPPFLVYLILSYLAFFPLCETCPRKMDMSGYVCSPNGALPQIACERNREFGTMSFKWWPREPTMHKDNVALVNELHAEGPWHRYYDKGGKHEIPPTTEVLTAGWVSRREHTFHCMYTLRQTHLWITMGYDPPFNYTHTKQGLVTYNRLGWRESAMSAKLAMGTNGILCHGSGCSTSERMTKSAESSWLTSYSPCWMYGGRPPSNQKNLSVM